jgi:hypothetical protein
MNDGAPETCAFLKEVPLAVMFTMPMCSQVLINMLIYMRTVKLDFRSLICNNEE